jgi:GT2 family glycosyltransferase
MNTTGAEREEYAGMAIQPGLVSVVIINFNSAAYIERCIQSIEAQDYPRTEILVIDNGSTDGSLTIVERMESDGRVRLLAGANVGSSRANNLGIRESNGEFVLVLNADAFPLSGYIQKCVSAIRKSDLIGTVIGKLVSDSDTSIIDSAGIYLYREGFACDRGHGEKDNGQYDREELVDGACCAAAMYRRRMLEDIRIGDEFYDEDFFAFVEDVELSFHAAMRGWTTLYLPSAIVRHVRGGSSKAVSEFVTYLNERNIRFFFRKDFQLVLGILDRVLQKVVLSGRRLTQYKYLTADARLKLSKEVEELGQRMDQKRSQLRAPDRLPAFGMAGRRSYLVSTILRRAGIKSI